MIFFCNCHWGDLVKVSFCCCGDDVWGLRELYLIFFFFREEHASKGGSHLGVFVCWVV